MTYFINVRPDNIKDFLQIVKSLKNLGVIDSFGSVGNLALEGDPISTEALLSILEASQKEAKAGNTLHSDEIKEQVAKWTQKPR